MSRWPTPESGGGGGDISGDATPDNALMRANVGDGKTVQGSVWTLDDNGWAAPPSTYGLKWGPGAQLWGSDVAGTATIHTENFIQLKSNSDEIQMLPEGETTAPVIFQAEGSRYNAKAEPSAPPYSAGVLYANSFSTLHSHPMWRNTNGSRNLLGWSPAKRPCRAASTANVASLAGAQTIDGVSLIPGDYVLLKDQSTASQNGPYLVRSGAWRRQENFSDADQDHVEAGVFMYIQEGTINGGLTYRLTTTGAIVIGTTPLTFSVV